MVCEANARLSVTSRKKLALRAVASSGRKGGTSRVLTLPDSGTFAMTAMAQRSAHIASGMD
jgi:hypothetical protein